LKILLNLVAYSGILTGSAQAFAEISSTIKLVRCNYQLGENETVAKVVADLVSSEKTFPLRTLGDDGWVAVTSRLNNNKSLETKIKPGESFELLVPEHRLRLKKDHLKNCNEIFYLLGTKVKPTETTVAQLTSKEPLADSLKESDISADFAANLSTMQPVERKDQWYFLLQYKKMVKEVRPIVEPAPLDYEN
jgi:hypothetical protein